MSAFFSGILFVVTVAITMDRAGFLGFVAFDWKMQKPNLAMRLGKAFFRLYFDDDDAACTGLVSRRH